jgi:ABC-type transport system involved in multi-copper enzyme maturation permease subunit
MTTLEITTGTRLASTGRGTGTNRRRIPLTRIVSTELRKMFDTRSGFWLLVAIAGLALLATSAVILWAPDNEMTYRSFTAAIGVPMTLVLPIIATLSVTGEWSQRSGLTTFTLVPDRSRVIAAKAIASVGVAVVTIPFAFGIGALGNVVGTAIAGVQPVWDLSVTHLLTIALANVLGLLVGFMLGVLIRGSAGALAAYFVYALLLPTLSLILATSQEWFRELQPWIDFDHAQAALVGGAVTAEQWTHLAATGAIWLVVPLVVGLGLVVRTEVK